MSELKNAYFVLRHGESVPNIKGIIVSDLEEGKKEENSLTQVGEAQVRYSIEKAKQKGSLDKETVIYSSPLSRCKRTAEIASDILGIKGGFMLDDRLRERGFGDWEGTSNANYQKVWDGDALRIHNSDANVESTESVIKRVIGLIQDLENMFVHKNILIVSHGDILQIFQTFFDGRPSSFHRNISHLEVAELRNMN
jgi:probable phosphoglycerate mutase